MSLQQSIILATTATSRPGGNETDRLALLAFKAKVTEDPLQVTSSWNATVHFCRLPGVTVLNLRVPETCGNHIAAFRKPELSLNLSVCSEFVIFNLFNNRLVGKIPSQLGEFSKLEIIHIGSNNLTGHIPPAFGNLSSLQDLLAGENHLVGRMPDGLYRLEDLTVVVRENRLTGMIPASLFDHSSLMAIDVGTNQIEGILPPHFGNTLPNLEFLSIYQNQFTGPFLYQYQMPQI
ncbi:hypothetical protein Acr_24g0011820 [Actinidia rufa]|uniref:Leucine-rich repeat-containing N-terminal plant-type domain-containing protein n=1 Tax=Actinidia rufa TaxID=165716 RepID=A0A7J0GW25_9ERIC|nr:hypothetical protein Acr_24g0011820 [Actinidia rufa]